MAEDQDPAADLTRPELVEGLSSRRFDPQLLINPEISEVGEWVDTDEGPGQLIRIPYLEGISWNVPAELILRNPRQPRAYFDPEKMAELEATIDSVGQHKPLDVIPIRLENGQIKFFILDGERRFRVMINSLSYENIDVTVKFDKNFWQIFAKSFISNESRAPQNPIERANTYKYLLENIDPEFGRNRTIEELAKLLGTEPNDIYVHLKLLDLPESVQSKIINGTLPKSNTLQFSRVQKALGNDLEAAKIARGILQQLYGDKEVKEAKGDDEVGKRKRVTREDVRKATQSALMNAGKDDLAATLEAQRVSLDIKSRAHAVENVAADLLEADTESVVEALRGRTIPPDVVRDAVRVAIANLTAALTIINLATQADPLPEVEGKPTFSQHIEAKLSSIPKDKQKTLAQILAEESDTTQRPLSSEELAEVTDMTSAEIGANIRFLTNSLRTIGIKLEIYKGQRLSPHGQYIKVPAYRMEWILPQELETQLKADAKTRLVIATQAEAIRTKLATLTALGVDPRRSSKGSNVQTITEGNIPVLEIPPDKGSFIDTIKTSANTFQTALRQRMVATLAHEADSSQRPLSSDQLGKLLKTTSVAISNNIRYLSKELEAIGMELQVFEIIQKDQNDKEYRAHAYRLAWKTEVEAQAATPTEVADTATQREITKLQRKLEEKDEELRRQKVGLNTKTRAIAELTTQVAQLGGQISMLRKANEQLQAKKAPEPKAQPATQQPEPIETNSTTILDIIENHESAFKGNPLAFEIAKLLAEPNDNGDYGMTSSDILDYLKDDFEDLSPQKIGRSIKILENILQQIGLKISKKKKDGEFIYKLEKLKTESVTTPAPNLELEAKLSQLQAEATMTKQALAAAKAEITELNEMLEGLTAPSVPPTPALKPAAAAPPRTKKIIEAADPNTALGKVLAHQDSFGDTNNVLIAGFLAQRADNGERKGATIREIEDALALKGKLNMGKLHAIGVLIERYTALKFVAEGSAQHGSGHKHSRFRVING